MTRKIIHLDLDAFFCAVEEQYDPSLAGKPFAVGGRPEERGVVASCSYAARRFGVHSAMPMSSALRRCPGLRIVPSRHSLYSEVSKQVMQRFRELTPVVEQISIDEAFLDVSDLPEEVGILAQRLQERIQTELKLPCSLGAATNKLVAKMATDVGKAAARGAGPPNAITVVPPGDEAAFLAPLPVQALWGVGPKTAERLNELGLRTISDLARWNEQDLQHRFGKLGRELSFRSRGIDDRPLATEHETKSISQEITFVRDIRDETQLRRTLYELSEGAGRRLRQEKLLGATVRLKIRWPDFTTLTRQETLDQATDQTIVIFNAAQELFQKVWQPGQAVRLMGVGVAGLGSPARQLGFWDQHGEKDRRLQRAVDDLRQRFGSQVVRVGSQFTQEEDNNGKPS